MMVALFSPALPSVLLWSPWDFQKTQRAGMNFPHGLRSQWPYMLRLMHILPFYLITCLEALPISHQQRRNGAHTICPWRCPSFLRTQASWLHCNLSSLMGSRKVTILYIIWLLCWLGAMLFPAFYTLNGSQKCQYVFNKHTD